MHCKECDYSTAKQYNLKRHIQSKHPVDADGSLGIGSTSKLPEDDNVKDSKAESKDDCKEAMSNRFQCDFCEKSFVQKNNLNRHIRADHKKCLMLAKNVEWYFLALITYLITLKKSI